MTIPSSRSLIFEVKSTGSELALGRLRTSSGIFGNDRVIFKNPSTPRTKISRLYLRKSWQVYPQNISPRGLVLGNCPQMQNKTKQIIFLYLPKNCYVCQMIAVRKCHCLLLLAQFLFTLGLDFLSPCRQSTCMAVFQKGLRPQGKFQ